MKDILQLPNGATYRRADLQVHTPVDGRFKADAGQDLRVPAIRRRFAEAFVREAKEKGITVLGITEHNDVSWVDELREAARPEGIVIFPGVEINTFSGKRGIHLLAIFDPSTASKKIDEVITLLMDGGERFKSGDPLAAKKDFEECLQILNKHGAVCIAPHAVGNKNGLLEGMAGQIAASCFRHPGLHAVDIPDTLAAVNQVARDIISGRNPDYRRDRGIACINTSDARSVEEIGKRHTLIKMSSLTIEGLRQAFLDHESRVKLPQDLSEERYGRILGARWEGGFLDGVSIRFSDNLNCLIGGKGTGKSTIIETIRYAFEREPRTDATRKQHLEILEAAFGPGSKVSVFVELPTGDRYVVERAYGYAPVVYGADGRQRPEIQVATVLVPEVYGQKEIYEISRDPAFQLDLIDKFVRPDLDLLEITERELIQKTEQNTQAILRTTKGVAGLEGLVSTIPQIEEQIARYKKSGIEAQLAEKKNYEKEKSLLERGLNEIDQYLEALKVLEDENDVDAEAIPVDETKELPNRAVLVTARGILSAAREIVLENLKGLRGALTAQRREYAALVEGWRSKFEEQEKRYQAILLQLQRTKTPFKPQEYVKLQQQLNELQPKRSALEREKKRLEELVAARRVLLTQLAENRRKQFQVRNAKIQELNSRLVGILQIELVFEGDKEEFAEQLSQRKSGMRREQITALVNRQGFTVQTFVDAIRKGAAQLGADFGLSEAAARSVVEKFGELTVLELESFRIPDRTTIKLNVGTQAKPSYQSTERLSVGQKCTAILSLILLESDVPLLIDQPEDDLDSKFVFDEVVKTLRTQKERRQFIVATHVANIPVLGDAELILLLSATHERAVVETSGSIDNPELKEPVARTLEGGKEAFELRRMKYGF